MIARRPRFTNEHKHYPTRSDWNVARHSDANRGAIVMLLVLEVDSAYFTDFDPPLGKALWDTDLAALDLLVNDGMHVRAINSTRTPPGYTKAQLLPTTVSEDDLPAWISVGDADNDPVTGISEADRIAEWNIAEVNALARGEAIETKILFYDQLGVFGPTGPNNAANTATKAYFEAQQRDVLTHGDEPLFSNTDVRWLQNMTNLINFFITRDI